MGTTLSAFGIRPEAEASMLSLLIALRDLADEGRQPPCEGIDAAFWTSDTRDERAEAAEACRLGCPVLTQCGTYADAQRERVHVFDGADHITFTRYTSAGASLAVTGSSNLANNDLHMLAVTHNGSTMRLYVDGAEEANAADASGLNVSGASQMQLGGDSIRGVGLLDDVAFFGYALSPTQVADLYAAGAA